MTFSRIVIVLQVLVGHTGLTIAALGVALPLRTHDHIGERVTSTGHQAPVRTALLDDAASNAAARVSGRIALVVAPLVSSQIAAYHRSSSRKHCCEPRP
jgi:hypothetical protein